jgi:hypothetical protein
VKKRRKIYWTGQYEKSITGLGLAYMLSKKIDRQLGDSIWVELNLALWGSLLEANKRLKRSIKDNINNNLLNSNIT